MVEEVAQLDVHRRCWGPGRRFAVSVVGPTGGVGDTAGGSPKVLEARSEVRRMCWRPCRRFVGGVGDSTGGTSEVLETLAIEMVEESGKLGKGLASYRA